MENHNNVFMDFAESPAYKKMMQMDIDSEMTDDKPHKLKQ